MPYSALLRSSDLAQRAFDRASGAPLISGNRVRILQDADGNFPVWLEAIRSAQHRILFENYIFDQDDVGTAFADALIDRARAGVKVHFIRDWVGSFNSASRPFWRRLTDAGIEVRVFNPPSLANPFGWISRDHRKMIAIDGRVGFVSGLCISKRWLGDPANDIPPWRDTGVEVRGPAVAWIERAFKTVWDEIGSPLPEDALTNPITIPREGDVSVRIIASEPTSTEMFRLDQIIAAAAQRTLWLTDAYFVGFTPHVQSLRAASLAGVDVRLLVPSTTDLPIVSPLSRSGYRPLLEAGVRIFEWNGSMIHAKTAVADGRWGRVGSSNLNVSSFIGNFELDVAIEDEELARQLELAYLEDLSNSTEITITGRRRVRSIAPRERVVRGSHRKRVGAVRFATAVGAAAASGTRALGAVESGIERTLAAALVGLAAIAILWPHAVAYPVAALGVWMSIALLLRARRNAKRQEEELKEARRLREREVQPAPPPDANSNADRP